MGDIPGNAGIIGIPVQCQTVDPGDASHRGAALT